MSSLCLSALASLDDSLGPLSESSRELKAAQSVDIAEVIQQLKMAAESACMVRESVWSEMPEACWQNREELDTLVEKIQEILEARILEQLRSRLLALATELERGSIVHRRAHRLSELNQLRDQAINELRSQAGLGAPKTLPGPQADQWIEWACGLKEPQDAESLQSLRGGFAHLDDFVANLELNMWIAAESPSLETLSEPKRSAAKTQAEQSGLENRVKEAVVSSGPNLAMRVGFDQKPKEAVDPMLTESPIVSQPQEVAASSETQTTQYRVPVLDALASLDNSLALLYESLEKLKAAQLVDITEVIQQLKMAAESARLVRELIWSEMPEASWQSREELNALIEKIQEILEARTLEQLRSRLLALATELERGSIVHRRALRLNELNQLRDQAINELRSQAGLEGTPQTLPGPVAGQWIEWACGLKEPQDAESLQTLRNGFAHLDDFVANLEPNMWIAAGSPTLEILPEPERSAAKTQPEQSRLETNALDGVVVPPGPAQIELEAPKSSGGRAERRFPGLLAEMSMPVLESNTLTPNDVTPPRTEKEIQRMAAQERALLASMLGLVTDPAGHFSRPTERPFSAEGFRETSATPASLVDDRAGHLNRPLERPFIAEEFRETSATPANLVDDPVGHFNRPLTRSFAAEVFHETSTTSGVTPDIGAGGEEPWGGKWRMLLATPAVLVLAALLVFGALGAMLWRSHRNQASIGPVKASERTIPGLTRTSPDDQNYHQSRVSTKSETHTSSPITQTQKQPKAQDQSIAPKPLSKASAAKQANELNNGVLRPPPAISRNVAMAKTEGTPPNSTAEMPVSIPGGVPNGVPNSVANIATDIPVAVSKVAPEKVRVSSGVAQGLLVHQVTPKYPPLARQARIQGTVVLQAVIGKDGSVQNLHVLSGHPMLTPAAMDAVRQWRYKPYRVNGEPVEADTQINVNFTLPGG